MENELSLLKLFVVEIECHFTNTQMKDWIKFNIGNSFEMN
jgi:hypothetical protein